MAEKMTPERASEILGQGFHCSQCVMGHAAEVMGLDVDEARKRTAALGGGMFWGEMCGAVLGAGVALGEAYGFDQANPGEKIRSCRRRSANSSVVSLRNMAPFSARCCLVASIFLSLKAQILAIVRIHLFIAVSIARLHARFWTTCCRTLRSNTFTFLAICK